MNAKVLKDIKFPVMLDMFDMCSKELQDKLKPTRTDFKAYEDWLVDQVCTLVLYHFLELYFLLLSLFLMIIYDLSFQNMFIVLLPNLKYISLLFSPQE